MVGHPLEEGAEGSDGLHKHSPPQERVEVEVHQPGADLGGQQRGIRKSDQL